MSTFTFDVEPLAGTLRSRTALRLIKRESPRWIEESRMDYLPTVVHAEYRGEFKIRVVFNDGVEGTIDFQTG